MTLQLITGILIGSVAGYLGSFMVLKRMALVGDALSHVALPGIAVAILAQFNPFIGAFTFLFFAILGIWFLEKNTSLTSETIVGIFFTLSLAIGLLLIPNQELLEALLGDISQMSIFDLWLTVAATIVVFAVMSKIIKGLTLGIISKELAQSAGFKINKINLIFLLLVATTVALGLKVAGTLLMGSLVIIPAAAAKNISANLAKYSIFSSIFGVISAATGIIVANYFNLHPGPMVVLTSGALFLITLLFKKL